MKKIQAFLLSAILLLSFSACKNQTVNTDSVESKPISTNASSQASSEDDRNSSSMELPGIKGSHYIDIKLSLEQQGFEKVHPKGNSELNCEIYNNNFIDPDTGACLGCDMTINNENEVVSASFSIENRDVVKHAIFIDVSNGYLGFCSTLPYETSNSEAAKEWVSSNIENVKSKPTKEIGDAKFTLSGTENAIILNVEKSK